MSIPADCAARIFEMLRLPPVVIDVGSGMCKVGLAGNTEPCGEFATIVGRHRGRLMAGTGLKEAYIGDAALAKRGILKLRYPVEHGMICNWDDLEEVWRHCFLEELHVKPSEQPIMLNEVPTGPKAGRERMAQAAKKHHQAQT